MINFSEVMQLVRPNIASLKPYSTARDEYQGPLGIYLDANENPFDNGYNRYPSTALKERVRQLIANKKQLSPDNLFLGNGSDEAIDLVYRIFCCPGTDKALSITPTYGMYEVCAAINDVPLKQFPLHRDFTLPTDELLAAADAHTKVLFVCSPNNPTGNAFPRNELLRLLNNFRGIVVVDEAYIDFSSEQSMAPLVNQYPNLIVLQTLSKAYGMAGLRIGLAIATEAVIHLFKQVKYPYNIGSDTLSLGEQILQTDMSPQIRTIISERQRVACALQTCACVQHVYPSDTNFLLVKVTSPQALYAHLIRKGLIVRDRSHTPGCEGALRITIGTPQENDLLIQTIQEYATV